MVVFFSNARTKICTIAYYSLILKRLRNRSIRPAVSTSFCLPVKKGWQAEQISTVIFFAVDRVSMTFPQAQVIVVSSYLGCMPSFMLVSFAHIIHCQNRQAAYSLT